MSVPLFVAILLGICTVATFYGVLVNLSTQDKIEELKAEIFEAQEVVE